MTRLCRATTAALIVCLFSQCTPAFANDDVPAASQTPPPLTLNGVPLTSLGRLDSARPPALQDDVSPWIGHANAFAQWGGYRRGRGRRHSAATAALLLGAAGTIAGSAILVYANRPECSANASLGGCGYGTKVVGGAVLSAGVVGLTIGAVTW